MNNDIIKPVRTGNGSPHIIKPVQPTNRPQPPVTRPPSPPIRNK